MASSTSRIVDLATTIHNETVKFDEYCSTNGIAKPSFDENFPKDLPAEVEGHRNAVLVAADELVDLMLGPRQLAENHPPQHTSPIGIWAVNRYRVAEKLGTDEVITFEELAHRCEAPAQVLTRLVRQAISKHVFKEPKPGYVAHNAASRFFLEKWMDDWCYVTQEMWQSAAHLLDAMDKWKDSDAANHTGFNIAKGTDQNFFQSLSSNPERNKAFSGVMSDRPNRAGFALPFMKVLSNVDWSTVHTVVDIGGGNGSASLEILRSQPAVKAIVQDLPEVLTTADEVAPEMAEHLSFMPHDFFEPQPVHGADMYLLRWVLHDWSDTIAISILRNLIPALKVGAQIVVVDSIMPDPGVLPFYYNKILRNVDLGMKGCFNARERELGEWEQLFREADPRFRLVETSPPPPGSAIGVIRAVWDADKTS